MSPQHHRPPARHRPGTSDVRPAAAAVTARHCTGRPLLFRWSPLRYCIQLHCTALYCTELNCTELHCTVLQLHCTALSRTRTALHCAAQHSSAQLVGNSPGSPDILYSWAGGRLPPGSDFTSLLHPSPSSRTCLLKGLFYTLSFILLSFILSFLLLSSLDS